MSKILLIEQHWKFLRRNLDAFPHSYGSLDSTRAVLLYFTLLPLNVLGKLEEEIDNETREKLIRWIYQLQLTRRSGGRFVVLHGCALIGGIQIRNAHPSTRFFPDLSSEHPLNYYIPQYNLATHWRKPFLIPHSIGFPHVLSRPLEWEYFWANAQKITGGAAMRTRFATLKSQNVVPYRAPGQWLVDTAEKQLKNRNLLCGMVDCVRGRNANVGGASLDDEGCGGERVVRLWAVSELTDRRKMWEYCCRVRRNSDEEDREGDLEDEMSEMVIGQSRTEESRRAGKLSRGRADRGGQEGDVHGGYAFDWRLEGVRLGKDGESLGQLAPFDADEETEFDWDAREEGGTQSRHSSDTVERRTTRLRDCRRNVRTDICGAEPVRAIQLPAPALQLISWPDDATDPHGTTNTPRLRPRLLIRTEESLCLYDIAGGRVHSLYSAPVDYVSPMPYMSQELLFIDHSAKIWFGDVELMGGADVPNGGITNNRLGRVKCGAEDIKFNERLHVLGITIVALLQLICPSDHPRLIYAANDEDVWVVDLRDGKSRGSILYKVPDYDDTKDCGQEFTYENAFQRPTLQHITCLSERRRMLLAVTSNKFCLVDERMPGIRYLEQAHSILEGGDYVVSAPRFAYANESANDGGRCASVDGFVYPLYALHNVGLPDVQQVSFFEHCSGQRSACDDTAPRHWSALCQPSRLTEPINIAHFLDEQAKYGIRLGSRERRRWFGDGPTRAIHVQDGVLEAESSGGRRGKERHLLLRMLSDGSLWYEWVSIQDDRRWEGDAIEKGVRTVSQMVGRDWTVESRVDGRNGAGQERAVKSGPIWERNVSENLLQQPESLITHWDILPNMGVASLAVGGASKRQRPQSPDIFDEDDDGDEEREGENEGGVMEIDQATPPGNVSGKVASRTSNKSSGTVVGGVHSPSRTNSSRTSATLFIPGLVTSGGSRAEPETSRSIPTEPASSSPRDVDMLPSSYPPVTHSQASNCYPQAEPITALRNENEQLLSNIVLKCWQKYT
ncbi:unnamed protein product [Anisakis simplex]|uniref:Geranylgeranyl transferase type-1 subunit beta (inferred by orthology to a human protein) n=1 Tax=Anisakis simplex TaxID=6269 RepID=A0A0M3KA15_ANISI|nr:unnamed protein product [Anisakis simplex]